MSYLCPVCNGLQEWGPVCPSCGGTADDKGRLNDYFGPYSPYQPIEEIAMINGMIDAAEHRCTHVAFCPSCGELFHGAIGEQFI